MVSLPGVATCNLLQAAPFMLVVFVVIWKTAAHPSRGEAATLGIALALLAVPLVVGLPAWSCRSQRYAEPL